MSEAACPLFMPAVMRDTRGAKTVGALCLQCSNYDLKLDCCVAPPQALLEAEQRMKAEQ